MSESDAGDRGYPDIGAGRVLLAMKATDFEMVFPAA